MAVAIWILVYEIGHHITVIFKPPHGTAALAKDRDDGNLDRTLRTSQPVRGFRQDQPAFFRS